MKVKFLTSAVSASQVWNPGEEHDIDDAWAEALIQSGQAESLASEKRTAERDKTATKQRGRNAVKRSPETR